MKSARTWQDVHRYCNELSRSMNLSNNEQFEITGVTLCPDEEIVHEQDTLELSSGICDMREDFSSSNMADKGNHINDCKPTFEHNIDFTDGKIDAPGDRQSENENEGTSGIEMMVVSEGGGFKFVPLSYNRKKSLCKLLGISRVYSQCAVSTECERMGHPDCVRNIQGDGNCFFRAISYAISGSERNYMRLRIAIVNHLLKYGCRYNTYLREGFCDVEDYIQRQRMFCSGVWATEVEIMAVAHMLETDIKNYIHLEIHAGGTYSQERWPK